MNLKIKFNFDKKIIDGLYSSKYFHSTKKIIDLEVPNQKSMLRFKHFNDNVVVAGISEVLQLIKFFLPQEFYNKTKIYYIEDGTITNADEPILILEGDYANFCLLENIIDGILSRRSSIATNTKNIVDIVSSERIIFMSDRSDDYTLFPYDGYAAYIGGIRKFVTYEHVAFLKNVDDYQVVGTIPHALIQQCDGSLVKALKKYKKIFPKEKIVGLIDFNNDCLKELEALKESNIELDFVRVDTSKNLIDKSLQDIFKISKDDKLFGVNEKLILKIREKLNNLGYKNTKIIATSSINEKIVKEYTDKKVPIDLYGIGKSFLNLNVTYTADLIKLNDKYLAKFGRDQNIDNYIKKMKKIH